MSNHSYLTIPLTRTARKTAQGFAAEQPNPNRADLVLLNTLAVWAVNEYLQLIDISTDVEAGDSWNPMLRHWDDVADLEVIGLGRLECRPVKVNEAAFSIPPEVWQERIGYIAVQIDEDRTEATLMGFLPDLSRFSLPSPIPLDNLQPIDHLLDYLEHLEQENHTIPSLARSFVNLSQWLEGMFEEGWQAIADLLERRELATVLVMRDAEQPRGDGQSREELIAALVDSIRTTNDEDTRWKAAESLWKIDPGNPAAGIRRFKILETPFGEETVLFMVGVLPKSEQTRAILLRLYPIQPQRYLPAQMTLTVLDETGNLFLEVQARELDNYIQLKFSGLVEERFTVRVARGEARITEDFRL